MAKNTTTKHIEGSAEYSGVKSVPTPTGNGYPVKIDNKKTVKVRGTGAATKGTTASSKMG